jgi:hypothetical protein
VTRIQDVLNFHMDNPDASAAQVAKALDMNPSQVRNIASQKHIVFRSSWTAPPKIYTVCRPKRRAPYAGKPSGGDVW